PTCAYSLFSSACHHPTLYLHSFPTRRSSDLRMSFIPGIIEGTVIAFLSTKLLNFTFIQGGILGFIIAAVSPAVVVPSMINLIDRSEEHTSELQSRFDLVCRLLLEKKTKTRV